MIIIEAGICNTIRFARVKELSFFSLYSIGGEILNRGNLVREEFNKIFFVQAICSDGYIQSSFLINCCFAIHKDLTKLVFI